MEVNRIAAAQHVGVNRIIFKSADVVLIPTSIEYFRMPLPTRPVDVKAGWGNTNQRTNRRPNGKRTEHRNAPAAVWGLVCDLSAD